jgi:hypothetical protein
MGIVIHDYLSLHCWMGTSSQVSASRTPSGSSYSGSTRMVPGPEHQARGGWETIRLNGLAVRSASSRARRVLHPGHSPLQEPSLMHMSNSCRWDYSLS